ncbi:putative enterotoxin [Ophiocordyceps australis]|uniref:Putative enterotoxin n=1 Tax=Ophiocordyceps australis TaxID=1399860 RepID=A0A2C5YP26_9HYPO|nr:putative enterotoxin [Ophiocordyceps australis]
MTLDEPEDPHIVYRADMLSPADLKLQGKFLPRGMDLSRPDQPPSDLSLYNHVVGSRTGTSRHDSGYVSTTKSLKFARQFLHTMLGSRGFIYKIHVSPSFIDVQSSLREFSRHPLEQEVAALGGIHYEQVLSWIEFEEGVEQPEVFNTDYETRFDEASWGGSQVQLAGFPKNHVAWSRQPWKDFTNCWPSFNKMKREMCEPQMPANEFGLEYVVDIFLRELETGKMDKPEMRGGERISTDNQQSKGRERTGTPRQNGRTKAKAKAKKRKSNKKKKVKKVKVAKIQIVIIKVSEGQAATHSKPGWFEEIVKGVTAAAAAIVPSTALTSKAVQVAESTKDEVKGFGIRELSKCAERLGIVPDKLAAVDVVEVNQLLEDIKDVVTQEFIDGLECAEEAIVVV